MAVLKTVGVKELKNRLSEYLREVKAGAVVLITERGTVVAELREPTAVSPPRGDMSLLREWAAEGRVHLPRALARTVPASSVKLPDGTAQRLLDLDRGE
jgi:antitoxin (DNA-binding transcriptional repressor) of toxin-antitoxin stability system